MAKTVTDPSCSPLIRRDTILQGLLFWASVVVINSACGGADHEESGTKPGSTQEHLRTAEREERMVRVLDCSSLPDYLGAVGSGLRSDVDVFGHTWQLRFRTPEEILCGEIAAGITVPGELARTRLNELRSLDQFVVTFTTSTEDAVANALSSGVPDEAHFVEIVGNDSLPCRFAHLEALGKGPWRSKLLLAFERDTTAAQRRIIISKVPGITDLRIDLPLNSPAIIEHCLVTKDFLNTPIGT